MQSKFVRFTALALAVGVTLVLLLVALSLPAVESAHIAAAQGEPQPTSPAEGGGFSLFLPHVERAIEAGICRMIWGFSNNPGATSWAVSLDDVAGTAANDVWAVGNVNNQGRILHWDGVAWSQVSSPRASWLTGVIAFAPDNAWAVGGASSSISATIFHWDGQQWTKLPDPLLTVEYPYLGDISGVGPDNMWAIGSASQVGAGTAPLVVHWNGAAWSPVPLPDLGPDVGLKAVSARAADDVWIVGWQGSSRLGLIMHWDGAQWSVVSTPQWTPELSGVTALSATDAWAVGRFGAVLHWDGAVWSRMDVPTEVSRVDLNDLAILSSDDVWAVGEGAAILHWDGVRWRVVQTPDLGPGEQGYKPLNAITTVTPRDLWAVGQYNPGVYRHTPYIILHGTSPCP